MARYLAVEGLILAWAVVVCWNTPDIVAWGVRQDRETGWSARVGVVGARIILGLAAAAVLLHVVAYILMGIDYVVGHA